MTLKHHVNPLDRWRENSSLLPHLAKKVRRLFCVPATFVPYERVFSMAGNIVTKIIRLETDNVNMLTFLKMNLDSIPKKTLVHYQDEDDSSQSQTH